MGSSFAPLRKDYRGVAPKEIRKNVERILILSGGTDQYNVIGQVLEGLNKSKIKSVDAVCGIYNPRFDQLTAQYQAKKDMAERARASMEAKGQHINLPG